MRIDFRGTHTDAIVTVDGKDVSDRCFLADEEAGEAHVYLSVTELVQDERGDLAVEILRGDVVINVVR